MTTAMSPEPSAERAARSSSRVRATAGPAPAPLAALVELVELVELVVVLVGPMVLVVLLLLVVPSVLSKVSVTGAPSVRREIRAGARRRRPSAVHSRAPFRRSRVPGRRRSGGCPGSAQSAVPGAQQP